jgi:peptide deformylase
MEEVIVLNTEEKKEKKVEITPLPLYDENFPMLKMRMLEYVLSLPNKNMNVLIERLKMTMKLYGGIGLSANQCGVMERVFVIGSEDFQMACINPRVISESAELEKEQEGCLSYPALSVKIPRSKRIEVEFMNEMGEIKQSTLEGLSARCFLHELDHMNGIRLVDKVGQASMLMARKKQSKRLNNFKKNKR